MKISEKATARSLHGQLRGIDIDFLSRKLALDPKAKHVKRRHKKLWD